MNTSEDFLRLPCITAGYTSDDDEDDDTPISRNENVSRGNVSHPAAISDQGTKSDTPLLDKFGMDMTKAASEGYFDPTVGREKEMERLVQVLSRRKKNNPVLIGEPGVGKSAIVEGLASRVVNRQVAPVLFDKRIINLDLTLLVAGTKYRGQFEERIKGVLSEVRKNPNIILFIDEIHTLVGTGSAGGSMDAANILKPALARGEIQCIGATTLSEYRKGIEGDGALERRFQKILVEPATEEETHVILQNIKARYEDHHHVNYTGEALSACVKLTGRYVSDRYFPDKAIDALDEAGSRSHMLNVFVPPYIKELEEQLRDVAEKKRAAAQSQRFELAANLRDAERNLSVSLGEARKEWEKGLADNRYTVDAEKIAEVVALMSGIPVHRIAAEENARLLEMEAVLKQQVIGQDEAVTQVVKAIRRNRTGLKDPDKPVGTFMFLGPTGVGKTHLAKKLAEFLFGTTDALIRIDMSEYLEKIAVSRLIGAPPGYVGYEEGGQLTEKVRRHPYAVVLLDEIEKAHPDVFHLLLQVLDEGRLTDGLGRQVDFKNTILIMTSNVGSRQLKDFGRGIGFSSSNDTDNKEYSRTVIQKALQKAFTPEFLNRIDDLITFSSLSKESIHRIIDLELSSLHKRLSDLGLSLSLSPEAKDYVAAQADDLQYGARPLKRAIQKHVEDPIADFLLRTTLSGGVSLRLDVSEGEPHIVTAG
ncbi:MAG: ATP-dependent Clp protease ATP-binding subunit [Tannerellaceae bacterium]|jgi:ATP-dependent Clp protease ATP-binding subunit ClpC|nr:ATP-dependent Clp protease ATP-binding subunit [Tannerellaceae bacterium]